MNTLRRTNDITIFAIMAPAFAAALTRNNGVPSNNLRARLMAALPDYGTTGLEFKRGDSGRWFVRTTTAVKPYPMKRPDGSHTKFTTQRRTIRSEFDQESWNEANDGNLAATDYTS